MSEQTSDHPAMPVPPNSGESLDSPPGKRRANPHPPELAPMWALIKRLPSYARLSAAIARDPRVPNSAKAVLAVGGVYLVSPIDLVPGIIPVAGQLDDLYVVLTGLQQAVRMSPPHAIDEHFAAAGLARSSVDEDLAEIRRFVRQGITWSLVKGGQAISRLARSATDFAQRARQRGETPHDQKSI